MTLGGVNQNLNLPFSSDSASINPIKFNSSFDIKINQIAINSTIVNKPSDFKIDIASPITYLNNIYYQ